MLVLIVLQYCLYKVKEFMRKDMFQRTQDSAAGLSSKLSAKRKLLITACVIAIALIVVIVLVIRKDDDSSAIKSNNDVVRYYQEKLPTLKKSVDEDGKDFTARLDYAVALYATGDLNEAKKQYEAAISMRGDDVVLRNNLGNVLRDKGDYTGAIQEYEKAIKIDPRSQNAYINLASLQTYTLNKPQDGIATYKNAMKAIPDNTQLELQLGLAYEQAGDANQAIKTFKSVLARDPANAAAKNNLHRLGAL